MLFSQAQVPRACTNSALASSVSSFLQLLHKHKCYLPVKQALFTWKPHLYSGEKNTVQVVEIVSVAPTWLYFHPVMYFTKLLEDFLLHSSISFSITYLSIPLLFSKAFLRQAKKFGGGSSFWNTWMCSAVYCFGARQPKTACIFQFRQT